MARLRGPPPMTRLMVCEYKPIFRQFRARNEVFLPILPTIAMIPKIPQALTCLKFP
jgi:hypothetical protein